MGRARHAPLTRRLPTAISLPPAAYSPSNLPPHLRPGEAEVFVGGGLGAAEAAGGGEEVGGGEAAVGLREEVRGRRERVRARLAEERQRARHVRSRGDEVELLRPEARADDLGLRLRVGRDGVEFE